MVQCQYVYGQFPIYSMTALQWKAQVSHSNRVILDLFCNVDGLLSNYHVRLFMC